MLNTYNKVENELEEEYIYRICQQKDVIGTWDDVATLLNRELNYDYSESKYRKQFRAFQKMFDAVKSQIIEDDAYLKEIDTRKAELEKERHKLYATKLEYNRLSRQESRLELYFENIRDAIATLPVPEFRKLSANPSEKISCLTISDIHYGASFVSQNNAYSIEECNARFEFLLAEVKRYLLRSNTTKLKIIMLGDTIQGILRISDVQLNETAIVKATVGVAKLISTFLNELSEYCEIDYYHVPTSNHTQIRPLNTKANELAAEDMEYIIGHYISDLLEVNPRVTVNLEDEKGYMQIPIFDFNTLAMHGHTIKNYDTAIRDLSHHHRMLYDYIFVGHIHNGKEIPCGEAMYSDVEVLVSPSFIGSDPFSDSIMKGSKGACKLYVFDEIYGHVETHKLILN